MKTILIIEDEWPLLHILKTKLEKEGYAVKNASTSKEAHNLLTTLKPDLMIIDIMLPGLEDGLEIYKQYKETNTHSDIPVIVLTNMDSKKTIAHMIGVQEYILKANTKIDDVVKVVHKYLNAGE